MNYTFSNKKLEKTLSNNRIIKKHYGRLAQRIIEVLDELYVATTLDDIPTSPPDRRHKLTGLKYTWSIDLSRNYRMFIESLKIDEPKYVTSVIIKDILDDH